MAPQARAAISAMSASSRTISPISCRGGCARPLPSAPLTLIGHSSGGGFALRVAGIADPEPVRAHRTAARPISATTRPTTRPDSGGWASARYSAHHRPDRRCAASASPAATRCRCWRSRCRRIRKNSGVGPIPTGLRRNFAGRRDFRARSSPPRPSRTHRSSAGADDELMLADKICRGGAGAKSPVDVRLLDGVNHHGHRQRADGGIRHRRATSPGEAAGRVRVGMTTCIDSQRGCRGARRHQRAIARRVRQSADLQSRQPDA